MKRQSSRRDFLAMGLALPVAGIPAGQSLRKRDLVSLSPAAPAELQYRTLGKTGLKVTSLGFGCMITSDASVVERAADMGINYFDTARGYQRGNNERMVGAALKRKRKDIYLSTKTHADSREGALNHLETSLRELGTDYLDIWYLHGKSGRGEVTDESLEAQRLAKKQGKIRFSGVSTHSGQQDLIPWLVQTRAVDVVLTAYNFTVGETLDPLIEMATQAGLGVIAMKVMAGGFRRARPGSPLYPKLQREGAMLAMLKWALKNPHVATTIPSMTDMDQLVENFRAMAEPFKPADEGVLAERMEFLKPLYCRTCGKCEGTCAQGLPVAAILRYLSYADGYGQFELGREKFQELPAEMVAARCSDCERCTVSCPYGVEVANRVHRAQELFA
jgi:predicted aldo/keto reductase-like oxidoreductase